MSERDEHLNDYIDGVLSADEAREVETELERDPALRAEVQALRALLTEAARLPKGVAPRRDLWADIESRLGERTPALHVASRNAYATLYRASLAAAAAVVIFVAGMWYARNGQPVVYAPPVATITTGENAPKVELASYKQIEQEYAGVRASLRTALDKARPDLAPETVKVVEDSLTTIDDAIREIETALASDPGNHGLIRSLVAVYDQEVGLLRQVAKIAERPGENNA